MFVVNSLTLSSSSCCLLFPSTAALRSSSFCLCSSSRLQRSSTVRSYCSRARRSFSLISCSRATGGRHGTHGHGIRVNGSSVCRRQRTSVLSPPI
ncbi:hypothetical protein EYF80_048707 [Liparis tanakae]|uniref:Secreted protein n=1 Tax=Liparis tanakae TaxID=230148 RepID=A0A4Z2FJL7_9TELE|nr:hypothetical protein EYF80_048707 [Liparis tanakae]